MCEASRSLWRSGREEYSAGSRVHGFSRGNASTYQAEAWVPQVPISRCSAAEPSAQSSTVPWPEAASDMLAAPMVSRPQSSGQTGLRCGREAQPWQQQRQRSGFTSGFSPSSPSNCRCRANSTGANKGCASRLGSTWAEQRPSSQQKTIRALQLEQQELQRQLQLQQQQLPAQNFQCKPDSNGHLDGHSCGSRCNGGASSANGTPSKSRSRSATQGSSGQPTLGRGPMGNRDMRQAVSSRGSGARELLQERTASSSTNQQCHFGSSWPKGDTNGNVSGTQRDRRHHHGEAGNRAQLEVAGQGRRCLHNGCSDCGAYSERLQQDNGCCGTNGRSMYSSHPQEKDDHRQFSEVMAAMPPNLPMTRAVCPTPYVLGSVCGRGERELPSWRSCNDSSEILGTCAEMINATCQYIFDVLRSRDDPAGGQLKILSAADGCSDDMLQDAQARYVPTSVMMAHAFATVNGCWQDRRTRIRVCGGDVRNAIYPWWQMQTFPWVLPSFIEHRFIALDNTQDFGPQLYGNAQCEPGQLFDVVLLRQGLCFCDDPSKVSTTWPLEVRLCCSSCVACRASKEGKQPQDAANIRASMICGVYRLEPFLCEHRPAYRLGRCVLRWCPDRLEWAVLDDADGGAWAYARGDLGHPILSRGPWTIWDGQNHVSDASFACNLVQPAATPPWHRMPAQRMVCAGVTGEAESVVKLLHRIASVLDPSKVDSFGLLHGAWTNGTQVEVEQLHKQLLDAAQIYNDQRRIAGGVPAHAACVLWRTAATQYWLQCDGIMLFQPGSFSDPFRAYGAPPNL